MDRRTLSIDEKYDLYLCKKLVASIQKSFISLNSLNQEGRISPSSTALLDLRASIERIQNELDIND